MKFPVLTIVAGVTLGVVIAPMVGLTSDVAESMYDKAYPVLEARAEVIHRTPTEWRVVMYSKKHRDCRLLEVQAYDLSPSNEVRRLTFQREDGAVPSQMPPGNFRSSTYIIIPPPMHRLALSFMHECSGRTVRTAVPITG